MSLRIHIRTAHMFVLAWQANAYHWRVLWWGPMRAVVEQMPPQGVVRLRVRTHF